RKHLFPRGDSACQEHFGALTGIRRGSILSPVQHSQSEVLATILMESRTDSDVGTTWREGIQDELGLQVVLFMQPAVPKHLVGKPAPDLERIEVVTLHQ